MLQLYRSSAPIPCLLFMLFISPICSGQIYNILNFGAVGDGSTVNTLAIQEAIDSCTVTGGTVLIPQGTFISGTIFMKNHVTLEIVAGATLKGSSSMQDYPLTAASIVSYADNYSQAALIHADGAEHISLKGEGMIDGNGSAFIGGDNRPYGLRFISCSNVIIEDLELRNSGYWMMHNLNIDTLTIRNLDIYNHSNSNNDGINVDGCREVLIENCTIDSNDDPLVFKASAPINCENIIARNCTLATWSRAIKIGTETTGGFRNILIQDCDIVPSALAFPPFIGETTTGINLSIVDGGWMEDITVENITMDGIRTPLFIRLGNRARLYTDTAATPPVGYARNITVRNIVATASTNITSTITGIPDHPLENVTLQNIQITIPGGESAVVPGFVLPENEAGKPDYDMFGETIPAYGLYLRHVQNAQINNVCITYESPDQRPLLMTDDVTFGAEISIQSGGPNTECIVLETGIDEVYENTIRVQYNPVNERIKIIDLNEQTDLQLFDLTGRLLFTEQLQEKESEIQLPRLNTAVYIVRIILSNGGVVAQKLLIQSNTN